MATTDRNGMNHSEQDGKFVSKEDGEKKREEAERIYNSDSASAPFKKKSPSVEEFFGEEFKDLKGEKAVEKLLKEQRGHVKDAFERPELGGITLVWGNEEGGLLHTILRRDEQLKEGTGTTSGIEMAKKLPEIIKKGTFKLGAGDRPNITYNGFLVVISRAFDDEKRNWVVTAMEPQNKKV